MQPRNDQVFQLSLTEIAFTIAFLLLLLLGYRLHQQQATQDAALTALAEAQAAQRATASLQQARADLEAALRAAGASDPDATISKLVDAEDLRVERDRLRRQVDDLDSRLSTLVPLRAEAASRAAPDAVAALGLASAPGTAGPHPAAANASSLAQAEKEIADLRGQVAWLANRLGAATGHGGRDYPPCWADVSGRIEFLFAIETKPGEVVVRPAWPLRRDAAARGLPGVSDLVAGALPNTEFNRRAQGVLAWSRAQNPECRHYVELRSSIADAVQSDRARLMVERFFYKSEVPR